MAKKNRELEIEQDLKTQHRHWIFQRIGIGFMIVFALASLLGLLGRGALSEVEQGNPDGIRVKYDRSVHYGDGNDLHVFISPRLVRSREAAISVSRDFIEKVHISKVTPEPQRVEANGSQYKYVFSTSSADAPLLVIFHLEAGRRGRLEGRITSEDGESVQISQFVFP